MVLLRTPQPNSRFGFSQTKLGHRRPCIRLSMCFHLCPSRYICVCFQFTTLCLLKTGEDIAITFGHVHPEPYSLLENMSTYSCGQGVPENMSTYSCGEGVPVTTIKMIIKSAIKAARNQRTFALLLLLFATDTGQQAVHIVHAQIAGQQQQQNHNPLYVCVCLWCVCVCV